MRHAETLWEGCADNVDFRFYACKAPADLPEPSVMGKAFV